MKYCRAAAFVLLSYVSRVFAHGENSESEGKIQYDADSFADSVPKENHFIMFYAPWCGHCSRLAPTWDQLSDTYNKDSNSNVVIAKVDCTVDTSLCSEQDVTGYPTLKFFKKGDDDGIKYRGTRDLASLKSFIEGQIGAVPKVPDDIPEVPSPKSGLFELTDEDFNSHISTGKHFIKFYAPWCGHCQQLAPVWEELAKTLEHDNDVKVAKIDCTVHKSACNTFEVKAYPTLLWIEDGKKVEKYQGKRSHEALKEYVSQMLGVNPDDHSHDEEQDGGEPDPVGSLGADSFQHGIAKGITFVKFFAPWCGHCKHLAPIWGELGKKFISNNDVKIAKVDCTVETEKDLCSEQQVDGFPTLILYKNGERVMEYSGSRSIDDLYEFVIKHLEQHHDEL